MARPRTVTPPDKELIKLGEELVEWAKVEDKEVARTRFSQWYSIDKHIIRKKWKLMVEHPVFSPYYEIACSYLAKRCMDKNVMSEGFGHRLFRLYEKDTKEQEDSTKKYEADLRKEESDNQPQKVIFEVNYTNDPNNPVKVSPKIISDTDTESA